MAANSWPSGLPDKVLREGYEEAAPANILRTSMDKGPAKVRRRTTSNVRRFQVRMELDALNNEVETFDDFVMNTLKGGSLKFDWTHPRTGTSVEFRFIVPTGEPPFRLTNVGGTNYQASFSLEILP